LHGRKIQTTLRKKDDFSAIALSKRFKRTSSPTIKKIETNHFLYIKKSQKDASLFGFSVNHKLTQILVTNR